MKYVVVLGDGMADEPIESLAGRTPLETAETPTMDRLAKKAETGLAYMVPEGMSPEVIPQIYQYLDMIQRFIIPAARHLRHSVSEWI